MAEMSKKNIGTHAGMVWGLLCDGRKWTYDELRDKLRLRDRDLNAALGWLAREDKIEFEHEGGSTQVYLKEAVGTNNFFF